MQALETSLFQPFAARILGWSRDRKWVRSAWRQLETSFSWLESTRILGWSKAKKFFKVPWEHLKHRCIDFIQVAFWAGQEQKMSAQRVATTWNIVFSTCWSWSRKCVQCAIGVLETSLYRLQVSLFKRQKNSCKCDERTWIIALSNSSKYILN